MKKWLIVCCIGIAHLSSAQTRDTADIFEVNKAHQLVLKPHIEQKINAAIEPLVQQKLAWTKAALIKKNDAFETDLIDALKFAADTIRLNAFLDEYDNTYSDAMTTMGMNWKGQYYIDVYDRLLNEYYKKALAVLTPKMKTILVNSQRKWLAYYEADKAMIFDLNYFGNHNAYLYNWGHYMEMLKSRVFFLKDIFNQKFMNGDAFLR